jgi:hypothetical protein
MSCQTAAVAIPAVTQTQRAQLDGVLAGGLCHREPGRFIRNETRLLQVAATPPLPMGSPCCGAVA